MNIDTVPAVNTVLLVLLMALTLWRWRAFDVSKIWDEIEAIKLRLGVQEKVSPCQHCRQHHETDCDDC